MLTRKVLNFDGWEEVNHFTDKTTGLDAVIAIHNSRLGPTVGGCRYFAYPKFDDQVQDALRLSEGMTYKNALAGLNHGGAKTTLNGNNPKTEDMLKSLAEALNTLGGRYITGEDVGMTHRDMEFLAKHTKFVSSAKGAADPSTATAFGVLKCLDGVFEHKGVAKTALKTIVVEGFGNVGKNVVLMLEANGYLGAASRVFVSEINEQVFNSKLDSALLKRMWHDNKIRFVKNIKDVPPDGVLDRHLKIYMPCAFGQSINSDFLQWQDFNIICGSANNQLADIHYAAALAHAGTTYVPDYLANSGGVVRIVGEMNGQDPFHIANRLDGLRNTTRDILFRAEKRNVQMVANEMAEYRFKG